MSRFKGKSTQSVHTGHNNGNGHRSIVPPIFQNAAYTFEDINSWRKVIIKESSADTYSRNTSPTVREFEQRVAELESAESGLAFATGMAAISTTLLALLGPGKRAVTVEEAYGATHRLFKEVLPRFGVECVICRTEDQVGILEEIEKGCNLFFAESPTNPMLKLVNIPVVTEAVHRKGGIVVIDNTLASPINQRPVEFGVDLVVHSATKYISGHGDVLGGVICGKDDLIQEIYDFRELSGAIIDPHSAFLMLRGLKTLALRVQKQNETAQQIAEYLSERPEVESVYYPGLSSHTGHEVAANQMEAFGGVLSFVLKDDYKYVNDFSRQIQLPYLAPNLGQVETIVGTATTTSHAECTEKERARLGIPDGLIRYSVGIEDADDLISDLDQALGKLG